MGCLARKFNPIIPIHYEGFNVDPSDANDDYEAHMLQQLATIRYFVAFAHFIA